MQDRAAPAALDEAPLRLESGTVGCPQPAAEAKSDVLATAVLAAENEIGAEGHRRRLKARSRFTGDDAAGDLQRSRHRQRAGLGRLQPRLDLGVRRACGFGDHHGAAGRAAGGWWILRFRGR